MRAVLLAPGLHRPGFRYLHAGVRSVDHAVHAVRAMERQEALADSIRDLGESWKAGAGDREVACVHNTGHPVADARPGHRLVARQRQEVNDE